MEKIHKLLNLSKTNVKKKDERWNITSDPAGTQMIIIEYYEQLHAHKFDRLGKVLQRDKLP